MWRLLHPGVSTYMSDFVSETWKSVSLVTGKSEVLKLLWVICILWVRPIKGCMQFQFQKLCTLTIKVRMKNDEGLV